MARLFLTFYFLMLIAETSDFYNYAWSTPLSYLYSLFLDWLPIKVSIFEIACITLAVLAPKRAIDRQMSNGPMYKAIKVSFVACLVWAVYGLVTGGQAKPINQQLHAFVFGLIMAMNASMVLRTTADFERLGRLIVYACYFRATLGFIFWAFVIPALGLTGAKYPPYMTTHHDTVLSVLSLSILVSTAVQLRTRAAFRNAVVGGLYIFAAIQLNNRRLAWASLAACLVMIYLMLPKNKVKQRIKRAILVVSPVILLYVAVGWGRTEPVFAPIRSLSSMGVGKIDNSTKARDNENLSMLRMIHDRPIRGFGWGQEWIEADTSLGVPLEQFPMYHYIPHNSVLAMYTFTGGVGFFFHWLPLFVGSFLNARIYRKARHPLERAAGMSGLCGIVIYMNQMWGDMGIYSPLSCWLAGACLAVAARISISSGVWPALPAVPAGPAPAAPKSAL